MIRVGIMQEASHIWRAIYGHHLLEYVGQRNQGVLLTRHREAFYSKHQNKAVLSLLSDQLTVCQFTSFLFALYQVKILNSAIEYIYIYIYNFRV
jgi:hypothetical protein